jgi:hypothetical protein
VNGSRGTPLCENVRSVSVTRITHLLSWIGYKQKKSGTVPDSRFFLVQGLSPIFPISIFLCRRLLNVRARHAAIPARAPQAAAITNAAV